VGKICKDKCVTSCYGTVDKDRYIKLRLRCETLNLRIKPEDRGLIDRAAAITGKSKTDFVLEAARRAAETTLLDRTLFVVSDDALAAFRALLDAPPDPNDKLLRTL